MSVHVEITRRLVKNMSRPSSKFCFYFFKWYGRIRTCISDKLLSTSVVSDSDGSLQTTLRITFFPYFITTPFRAGGYIRKREGGKDNKNMPQFSGLF